MRDNAARLKMESVSCNLCGSSDSGLLYVVRSFNVVRCKTCGLVFVNPRLRAEELEQIYNSPRYYDQGYPDYKSKRRSVQWEAYLLLKNISRLLGATGGSILDIGCSFGFFLDAARKMGYEVRGIEISEQASAFARNELDLDVRTVGLDEAGFDSGSFDVVTMWDVIEHLTEPKCSLQKIHRWLKPSGILALSTPNITSPLARWTQEKWEQIKPEYHLYYFSPATVRRMCEAARFSVLRISTTGLGGTYKLISGKRLGTSDRAGLMVEGSRGRFLIKQVVNRLAEVTRTGERLYVYARK